MLLHAEGEFAALWTTVIPDLVHTHRVIAPDLPGHGESDAAGPLDVAHVVGWLAELVERTCTGPPTLVGRGLGAAIAARVAVTGRPLAGLVLTTALGLAEFEPAPSFAAAVDGFSAQPTARTRDLMFAQCFADLDGLRRRMGERWEPIADYALERFGTPQMQAAMAGLLPAFLPPIPAADLREIAVPTTLIWGREDRHVALAIAEAAHRRYGWPLHVIDDAGDDPPMEQPQAFLAALRAAIGTQAAGEPVMTTATAGPRTARNVLDAVHELAPSIADRAAEIERARRLPADLLDDLKRTGCFRMLLPPSHGGLGVSMPDAMRVYEALSRADASVGWTVMIGSGAWIDLAGLPRATFDTLYADGPDVIIGGAFAPSGTAERVDGGYRVSGRWAFASGCEHSAWLFGNCVEQVDGEHRLRMVVFAPAEVEIEDTWTVSGLCGTGSHHFAADEVLVPAERTFPTMESPPCLDIAAVAVPDAAGPDRTGDRERSARGGPGGAGRRRRPRERQGAPARIRAAGDEPAVPAPARDGGHRAARRPRACCTGMRTRPGRRPSPGPSSPSNSAPGSARRRSGRRHGPSSAVDFAYHAGGGGSLYASSPLQRRLRDVHAITQHFLVKPDTLTTAGAVLAGQGIDVPVF